MAEQSEGHRNARVAAAVLALVVVSAGIAKANQDEAPPLADLDRFHYECQPATPFQPYVITADEVLTLDEALRRGWADEAAEAVARNDRNVRDYAYSKGPECAGLYELYGRP